ncbi:hypothetical protein [Micromonospora narathiwatensis]|uniref:Integral membrane protein n=1 Tax=Micromonospora narathiwatensis TaxID=299146 RepID=A0A1A9A4B9_9ACTN|nr:hypothetical protein [Micromonospora narathiwatensis]SBT51025.1 hypothetical protein GA0070621_3907 [Micromonospora narathiwatensis]
MVERVLELRVHGVSNTPPDQLLGLRPAPGGDGPTPRLVAGGAVTGFYRSTAAGPDDPITVEAYSWGQLTSGARTARDVERALWTLLLPFTLANVALYARTGIPSDPGEERWSSRSGIAAWLVRLFALSLTGTLVITVTGVGVDLIGWQCVGQDCLDHLPGPWDFLANDWWRQDTRALAVGLLLPLLTLVVLGAVAWRTYQYEAEMPADPHLPSSPQGPDPAVEPVTEQPEPPENPLQDPTFWCGEGQLRRSGVLHLCVGAVVAAAVPVAAVIIMDPPRGFRAFVAWPTVVVLAAVVAIAVVALGRPWLTRRQGHTPLGHWSTTVALLTGLGLLGTFMLLLLPDGPAGRPLSEFRPPTGCVRDPGLVGCQADRSLPGYDTMVAWLATYQALLLVAIGAVTRTGRRALAAPVAGGVLLPLGLVWIERGLPGLPPAPDGVRPWMLAVPAIAVAATGLLLPRTRPAAERPDADGGLAWGGRGPAVVAGFGWMMAVAYCAGLLHWVSGLLDSRAGPAGPTRVTPPPAVSWAGLACVIGLLALAGVLIRAGLVLRSLRRAEYAALTAAGAGLSAHDLRRAHDVSTFRALHRLVGEHAIRLVGCYAAGSAVLVACCCAAALAGSRPGPRSPSGWEVLVGWTADLGDRVLGWLPLVVAVLGLLVYRSDAVRRTVGVIWDIGTFWPRAAHPLAPPSYAERAVPELQTRVAGLLALTQHDPRRMDGVILSGHSQGTVICAATLLQLSRRWRQRIWFFSYGCQFTRLYGRVFPAYFGPARLRVLTRALTRPGGDINWTNFWRDTDPLGWQVSAGERDVPVADPEALHPSGGEVADPPIRNHSGYPDAIEFLRERAAVARLLRRTVPSPRQGVG